jgi:hypothetical protein
MFGSNSAFGSSDSADTDMIKSSESESDADTGESDEEDHPVTDLSLGKPFKSIYECLAAITRQSRITRSSSSNRPVHQGIAIQCRDLGISQQVGLLPR